MNESDIVVATRSAWSDAVLETVDHVSLCERGCSIVVGVVCADGRALWERDRLLWLDFYDARTPAEVSHV